MNKKWKIIIPIGIVLLLGVGGAFGWLLSENKQKKVPMEQARVADSIVVPEPVLRYGFNEDSFHIFDDKVRKNENLSDILIRYGLDYSDIYKIANLSKDIFNVRRFRRGNKYTMFCKKDTSESLDIMVYEVDNTDYIVFDLRDSIKITREVKDIRSERKTASGIIESSLYQTLVDNAINPIVAIELSSIFAWQIDFYHLQKGDKFKVIFHEQFVEDKSIGIKEIEAAYFEHYDSAHYAMYFEQDSIGDYFNIEGKSLRSAFLKTPLEFGRLTSKFTNRRFHPVQKRWKAHLGTDYAAARGTPIRSTGAGTVLEARYSKFNGRYVKVKHNGTYTTQYLHMSRIAKGMTPGARVRQGQTIGYVGSSGLATGPHVCYRFWKNGKQVDPKREKFPPSKPVKPNYAAKFDSVKLEYQYQLEHIEYMDIASDQESDEKTDSLNVTAEL